MMRQRQHDQAQFVDLGPPTRDETASAEYLLLLAARREMPGGPANQGYMRLAVAIAALIDAHEKLNPKLSSAHLWPGVLKAMSSTVGVIFGAHMHKNAWHEQTEALVRDIYLTAQDQRRQAGLS